MQNVCERCKPGYNTTDDGLNCVCMPGTWHSCVSGSCTCLSCDKGMFCPGGWRQAKNYAPEDQKGQRLSCEQATVVGAASPINTTTIRANGLTTKSSGAKRPQDCVPMPGFYLASTGRNTQKAALCPKSTYSPGYGRIRQCLKCQSGTEEKPDADYATDVAELSPSSNKMLRVNRTDVCQVGPGRYLVQNVVRDCPAGSFRKAWSQTIESNSRYCFTCPPGVTTNSTRATDQTACNVVAPGVSMNMSTLESAQTQAAAGDNSLASNDVALCPYGTYFPGGVIDSTTNTTCLTCPFGTTTQFLGAASINECQIPPGYYIKVATLGDTLTTCPTNVSGQGYYRSGWTSYTDITARDTTGTTACTACGVGILSALTDIDELGGGNDTSKLVAGSSFSCYIEAGWGMVPAGVVNNTLQYSAVECSNNTYGVANKTYGLQSTPCKPCQRNLITLQPASTNYTQCVNPAGFGYSPGGATGEMSSSVVQCDRCPAGFEFTNGPGSCSACPAGKYQPGYLGNDASGSTPNFGAGLSCLTCPTTLSVYISSNGTEKEFNSTGTTYRTGAASRDECVPKTAQLGIDVGTKFFGNNALLSNITISGSLTSPEGCMDTNCGSTQCCFVQFDYAYRKNGTGGPATRSCLVVKMDAASSSVTNNLLYYKMLPSDAIAAASLTKGGVEAKAMSSGLYARCSLPIAWTAAEVYDDHKAIGKKIANTIPASNLTECKRRCDMMSICWGFTVQGGQCQLRGGIDEQDVRSFFRNPADSTTQGW
ncbi:hypothetical protein OEZ85_013043 [Tetradesmus obliquus]|uniref:Tyrosine-protein kinase ephrin type A/B receptor-like domain-containing protein n=1 Tax=Tetradesmus obliquus TaxID=3088 RepID=A0ABY8U4R4_TETOB|nr:hypothetical protein OEZ85_013043 [Tetradesmus obliquus]